MSLFRNLFQFSTQEVAAAFKHAHAHGSRNGLKVLEAPQSSGALHGKLLIITNKSLGKAHDRNRIKRQIKAIFYEEKLYQKQAIRIMLVYPKSLTLSFDDLKKTVQDLLQ